LASVSSGRGGGAYVLVEVGKLSGWWVVCGERGG
jgi:hypothetical protein